MYHWFCRFYIVKFILVEPRTRDAFTEFRWLLLKPSTDERGTDAELCVSSPHFTRHRRKFVQTFKLV